MCLLFPYAETIGSTEEPEFLHCLHFLLAWKVGFVFRFSPKRLLMPSQPPRERAAIPRHPPGGNVVKHFI